MSRKMTVAAVHAAPILHDAEATTEKACDLIAEAGRMGVNYLVFPEVFLPGFPYWLNCYPPLTQMGMLAAYQDASVEADGPEIQRICDAARRAGVVVALGFSERQKGGRTCYNAIAFIEADGTLIGVHRKIQPTLAERYIWGQGDGSTLSVWDSSLGNIGGLCCWEHTMNLARQALIGQNIQLHAACWPGLSTLKGYENMFDLQVESMMRTHALTGGCFVIVAECYVTQENIDMMERELGPQDFMKPGGGWSGIIHPWGVDVVEPHTGPTEKIVAAEINLDDIKPVKAIVDGNGHYSRPDVVRMVLDRQEKRPLNAPPGRPEEVPEPHLPLDSSAPLADAAE